MFIRHCRVYSYQSSAKETERERGEAKEKKEIFVLIAIRSSHQTKFQSTNQIEVNGYDREQAEEAKTRIYYCIITRNINRHLVLMKR